MKTKNLHRYIVAISMALLIAGCIATTPEGTSESEQVASTQDDLTGVICETAPHDYSFSYNGANEDSVTSSATYDHNGCRHSYIVDGHYSAPGTIAVAYAGNQLLDDTVFPCDSEWIQVKVLLMPSGAVVASTPVIQGTTNGNFGNNHFCSGPSWWMQLNRGDYRILATAGFINAAYEPMVVGWGLQFQ